MSAHENTVKLKPSKTILNNRGIDFRWHGATYIDSESAPVPALCALDQGMLIAAAGSRLRWAAARSDTTTVRRKWYYQPAHFNGPRPAVTTGLSE